MTTTVIGITGTRTGGSALQLDWLYRTFEEQEVGEVHHGACIGIDSSAHFAALEVGARVHVWPPTNPILIDPNCLLPHPLVTVHPNMPYLNRNREIVRAATVLIGFPKEDEEPEPFTGGTWYTINFARRTNKPVVIVYPDGHTDPENPWETTR